MNTFTWTMCEFHNSNSNGLGDIWWTDKCSYFSSIDYDVYYRRHVTLNDIR